MKLQPLQEQEREDDETLTGVANLAILDLDVPGKTPDATAVASTFPGCDNPGLSRAIEKIRTEYSRPLTVSSLARECGMSVRSLHRLYRSATGNTIGKDLVARRLKAAAEMLREDDVKLEPVAMETGLGNAKNLCRLFKEHIGITPGQWKESFHGPAARTS